jgi:hypothetical protein
VTIIYFLNMRSVFLLALIPLALASGCKKDEQTTPAPMQLSGTLSGSAQVPAVQTSATGIVTGTYDKSSTMLSYSVTYTGLTPNGGHFHYGAPGKTGNVVIPFTSLASPITGAVKLSPAQADSLLAGRMYVNLHTAAKPDGEIRANVVVK